MNHLRCECEVPPKFSWHYCPNSFKQKYALKLHYFSRHFHQDLQTEEAPDESLEIWMRSTSKVFLFSWSKQFQTKIFAKTSLLFETFRIMRKEAFCRIEQRQLITHYRFIFCSKIFIMGKFMTIEKCLLQNFTRIIIFEKFQKVKLRQYMFRYSYT